MKKIPELFRLALGFAFTFILCGSSCEKNSIEGLKNEDLNSNIQLSLNEKALVNKEFIIELTKIEDSRCPADVQCIWAGRALIEVKISGLNEAATTLNLCIGQCDPLSKATDRIEFKVDNIRYTILLKDVIPYPKSGVSADKKAVLIISKV